MRKKTMIKITAFILTMSFLVVSAGCGKSGAIETQDVKNGNDGGTETVKIKEETKPIDKAKLLAAAEYPAQVLRPAADDWSEEGQQKYELWRQSKQHDDLVSYTEEVRKFYNLFSDAIADRTEDGNVIYSPVNIYLALAMLAEITGGETQQEVLDALGTDAESLAEVARAIFFSNFSDDGVVTSKIANSLWLRNDMSYKLDKINELKEKYYASSFSGEMGSLEYNSMIQNWINENTGNLLQEAAAGVEFDPATVLALASTIYFKAPWLEEFSEAATDKQVFHGQKGDKEVDFLHSEKSGTVYRGDGYTAYQKAFNENGGMMFILPDEGTSVSELFKSKKYEALLFGNLYQGEENQMFSSKRGNVRFSVPKFDVEDSFEIIEALKAMGIKSVTSPNTSDFEPISDTKGIYLDSALHAARVKIDEEGVEAAAFTVLMMKNTAFIQPEIIDFTVDRPFIFVITDENQVPTFVGVVNDVE